VLLEVVTGSINILLIGHDCVIDDAKMFLVQ
jgi:hypothetical protein